MLVDGSVEKEEGTSRPHFILRRGYCLIPLGQSLFTQQLILFKFTCLYYKQLVENNALKVTLLVGPDVTNP